VTRPDGPLRLSLADLARFWSRVTFTEGCWTWPRNPESTARYGSFCVGGQILRAHRVAYMVTVGPIPDGLVLDHLCRNTFCVRPDHLEAVTQGENVRRGNVGDNSRNKTHCPQGHEFSEENTMRTTGRHPQRRCRTCDRDRSREYQRRKAAERRAQLG
jgi:hypothetical protein